MDRRNFTRLGVGAAAWMVAHPVWGQVCTSGTNRAIVIGVDNPGPPLRALKGAVTDAEAIARWLCGQGFRVDLVTDRNKPVGYSQILQLIGDAAEDRNCRFLIIYFAGHGFLKAPGYEYWILSGAPRDSNAAISVRGAAIGLENIGIKRVVLISDACRSFAEDARYQGVVGTSIVPNIGLKDPGDVDLLFGTKPGSPAEESALQDPAVFNGFFTKSFLEMFDDPEDGGFDTLPNGDRVIMNKTAKSVLMAKFDAHSNVDPLFRQRPHLIITSGDNTVLGRLAPGAVAKPKTQGIPPRVTVTDAARYELARVSIAGVNLRGSGTFSDFELRTTTAVKDFRFESDQIRIIGERGSGLGSNVSSLSDAGLTVSGVTVTKLFLPSPAAINGEARNGFLSSAFSVKFGDGRPGTSTVVRFEDGSGTVVALLRGYTTSVVVDRTGVTNVSYSLIGSGPDRELDELHAVVAAASRNGVFRVGDKESAQRLADRVRQGKFADPSLGIYAAYAFDESIHVELVKSVQNYLRERLRVRLFDIAMLARELGDRDMASEREIYPFCPMMTQGWLQLRLRNVRLNPLLEEAQRHLRPSLWTTLQQPGLEMVTDYGRSFGLK